jgi:hypothetical protein
VRATPYGSSVAVLSDEGDVGARTEMGQFPRLCWDVSEALDVDPRPRRDERDKAADDNSESCANACTPPRRA